MIRPAGLLLAELVVLVAGFSVLGGWFVLILRRLAPSVSRPPSALVGIVVAQIVGWYFSAAGVGLDRIWAPLLTISAATGAVLLALSRPAIVATVRAASFRTAQGGLADLTAGVLTGAVVVITTHRAISRGLLSVASPNNDVAFYAGAARHLKTAGFDDAGPVSGYPLGAFARADVYGEFNTLALSQWMTGRDASQVAMATMVLSCVLLSMAGCKLLRRVTDLPAMLCALIAAVPVSTFFFTYMVANFFGSQILAMAFGTVAANQVILYRHLSRRVERLASLAATVIALAGLDLTYPHMLFLLLPVIVGAAILGVRLGLRDSARVVVAMIAALVITTLVLPQRTYEGLHRLVTLSTAVAGWSNPWVLPSGLVGVGMSATGTFYVRDGLAISLVVSVILVVLSIASGIGLHRREGSTWALTLLGLALTIGASYAMLILVRGSTAYLQWKWIAFFQPLAVLALLAPIAGWLTTIRRRSRAPWLGGALAATALVAMLMSNGVASNAYGNDIYSRAESVSLELSALGRSPGLADVSAVNIEVPAYWESMWAVVSLYPRTVYLQNDTYYVKAPPIARWTLVRRDAPPRQPVVEERVLNTRYSLVDYAD